MKRLFLTIIFLGMICCVAAQEKSSNNASLDSLKESIKNIGRLFKKATVVELTVKNTAANDKDLNYLLSNIKQVHGVTKIKESPAGKDALFSVSYKGSGTELWTYLSVQAKQKFDSLEVTDQSIVLDTKPANMPVVAKPAVPVTEMNKSTGTIANKNNQADPATLTKGAALLFGQVKSKLDNSHKNQVFNLLGFGISKDGKQFYESDGGEDYPFTATAFPVDLNKDGVEEIFVLYGNSYTSGITGSSIVAFIADKKGDYQAHLGYPGASPDILSTSSFGYPDLLIGGPGFEFPVQRWNGKTYDFYKKVKDSDYAKLKKTNLMEMSKAYTNTIK